MLLALISFVIIILITASLGGMRFRLIQHRSTREDEGREIPSWLDSMIGFLMPHTIIWNIVFMVGVILFSIRLCLFKNYYMILVVPMIFLVTIAAIVLIFVTYKCIGKITSQIFSKFSIEDIFSFIVTPIFTPSI